jgi:hypothetical protein
VTSSYLRIKDPANIALLSLAVVLLPCFVLWVRRQEKLGKPAIKASLHFLPLVIMGAATYVTLGFWNAK